jgi:hypothetical protein
MLNQTLPRELKNWCKFSSHVKAKLHKNAWHKRPACTSKKYYNSTNGMT